MGLLWSAPVADALAMVLSLIFVALQIQNLRAKEGGRQER